MKLIEYKNYGHFFLCIHKSRLEYFKKLNFTTPHNENKATSHLLKALNNKFLHTSCKVKRREINNPTNFKVKKRLKIVASFLAEMRMSQVANRTAYNKLVT